MKNKIIIFDIEKKEKSLTLLFKYFRRIKKKLKNNTFINKHTPNQVCFTFSKQRESLMQ